MEQSSCRSKLLSAATVFCRFARQVRLFARRPQLVMSATNTKFRFSIDRGGTFTDVYAEVCILGVGTSHAIKVFGIICTALMHQIDASCA
jgi:hypothetical protein